MRKSILTHFGDTQDSSAAGTWLPIADIAMAELSSEDPEHPFEDAVKNEAAGGWRASAPGPQLIRLRFDRPQVVRRIRLECREGQVERTQEIALFATAQASARKELVRQQWVFSPGGATLEVEDYFFDLKDVTVLELEIDPGRHDKRVFASLQSLQIG